MRGARARASRRSSGGGAASWCAAKKAECTCARRVRQSSSGARRDRPSDGEWPPTSSRPSDADRRLATWLLIGSTRRLAALEEKKSFERTVSRFARALRAEMTRGEPPRAREAFCAATDLRRATPVGLRAERLLVG